MTLEYLTQQPWDMCNNLTVNRRTIYNNGDPICYDPFKLHVVMDYQSYLRLKNTILTLLNDATLNLVIVGYKVINYDLIHRLGKREAFVPCYMKNTPLKIRMK